MFLGHFGVALAAKKIAPQTSLGTLIFAAEFTDAIWPLFLLLGWEQARIAPGLTRMTPLDFTSYPWSHSLLMQFLWGAAFGLVYYFARRGTPLAARDASVVGALVPSHWILDWIVHRPDLPLTPWSSARNGLGVWNSRPVTVIVEVGLLALGLAVYLRVTRAKDLTGKFAFWSLIVLLVIAWAGSVFGPPPPSERMLAWSSLLMWLTVPWAWWADRHREPRLARR